MHLMLSLFLSLTFLKRWYLVVLICNSLICMILSIFSYPIAICSISSLRCVQVFCPFLNGLLFTFFLLSFTNSLYILDSISSLHMCLNIFSPICALLFILSHLKINLFKTQLLTYQEMLVFHLKLVDITELKNQDTIFYMEPQWLWYSVNHSKK